MPQKCLLCLKQDNAGKKEPWKNKNDHFSTQYTKWTGLANTWSHEHPLQWWNGTIGLQGKASSSVFVCLLYLFFWLLCLIFLTECNRWWLNLTEKTLHACSNHNLNHLQNEHQTVLKVVITTTNQGHSNYIPGQRRHVYHGNSWSNYCNSSTIWVEQCLTGSGKYV